jgi:hypothetical protein
MVLRSHASVTKGSARVWYNAHTSYNFALTEPMNRAYSFRMIRLPGDAFARGIGGED